MAADPDQKPLDETRLKEFMGKVVGDFGAALSSVLAYIGQKHGLYKALAARPATPAELAERTGTVERYVREWLVNQAAGGYVEYDRFSGRYSLSPEQVATLVNEDSPYFVGGSFYVVKALARAEERIGHAFKHGGGMFWGEHDPDLFVGTERFFRPGYASHLVAEWIPALQGADAKLKAGGTAADIGCGHGASTIIMAKAYPNSRFYGFDNHDKSIEHARRASAEAGVAERTTFEVSDAARFPDHQYDMVCFFDSLHDMGDPVSAARRACQTLSPTGSAMIVEPMAGNRVEENLNPIGRAFSAASTLCCTPNSLASGGPGLGAICSDDRLRETVLAGGFKSFERATQTAFNRIFEARK